MRKNDDWCEKSLKTYFAQVIRALLPRDNQLFFLGSEKKQTITRSWSSFYVEETSCNLRKNLLPSAENLVLKCKLTHFWNAWIIKKRFKAQSCLLNIRIAFFMRITLCALLYYIFRLLKMFFNWKFSGFLKYFCDITVIIVGYFFCGLFSMAFAYISENRSEYFFIFFSKQKKSS